MRTSVGSGRASGDGVLTRLAALARTLLFTGVAPLGAAAAQRAAIEPLQQVRGEKLELLGSVRFEVPSSPDLPMHLGRRFLDPLGRLWLSQWDTGTIHVFDPGGPKLFTCWPEPEDGLPFHPFQWFRLTSGGHLQACTRDTLVEFDPWGRRLACTRLDGPRARRLEGARGLGYWEVSEAELRAGRAVLNVESESKRFGAAAAAPDGRLAVCEAAAVTAGIPTSTKPVLHLMDRDGRHRASLALPNEGSVFDLAFDGQQVILLVHLGLAPTCGLGGYGPPWEIWTVDADIGRLQRSLLPEDLPDLTQVFLSPSTEEIWVTAWKKPVLFRFPRRR
jgi:hypothetical protein